VARTNRGSTAEGSECVSGDAFKSCLAGCGSVFDDELMWHILWWFG
jgi:hypothetical protein